MSLILNIETSSKSTSVALAQNGKVIGLMEEHNVVSHANKLTPFVQKLVNQSVYDLNDLDAIAISIGPGSYTGLRIGLSVAKGLCYSLNIPILSMSSLTAMLHELKQGYEKNNKLFVSTMNSRKNEIYCACYDNSTGVIGTPEAIVLDDNFLNPHVKKEIVIGGTGIEKINDLKTNLKITYNKSVKYSATNMALPTYNLFQKKKFADLAYLEPEYLKPFITSK